MSAGHGTRVRLWAELVAGLVSGLLGLLTLMWRDWIEVLGWEPDGGSGMAEWAVVAVFFVTAGVLGVSARLRWRRLSAAAAA